MVVFVFASLLFSPASPPTTLAWTPKKGDKAVYETSMKAATSGMQFDLGGTTTETVVRVEGDVVVVEENAELTSDSVSPPPIVSQIFYKSDGTFTSVTAENHQEDVYRTYRLKELILPSKPLSVGDTWSFSAPADKNASMTGVKLDYKLAGEEKVGSIDTYRIEAKGAETGESEAKVVTTYWIEKSSGRTIRKHFVLTNLAFPGDNGRSVDIDEDYKLKS